MTDIARLLEVMQRLRDPETGCPWDLEQDFSSIAPYTIEEAYEVADAIERGALADGLPDELGDLLFQVVFHAQMASEAGLFDFADVVQRIVDKMVRRHPHVFADAERGDSERQLARWEEIKAAERAAAGEAEDASVLAGIATGLPALQRAEKLGGRASRVGFDWPDAAGVRAKVGEELAELDAATRSGDPAEIEDELGDLLFSVAQLARRLDIDPARALRRANDKFERRFRRMEQAADGPVTQWDAERWDAAWRAAKRSD